MSFELRDFNTLEGDFQAKVVNHPNEWKQVQETQIDIDDPDTTIDIDGPEETLFPEASAPGVTSETAALLPGASTFSILPAGAAVISNVPVAAVPLLVGAAAIAGHGILGGNSKESKLSGKVRISGEEKDLGLEESKSQSSGAPKFKAHWPGHEFLGPGTNLQEAGNPVDRDDEIAKAHDEAYQAARSNADIRDADSIAIGQFEDDFAATGNLHSKASSFLLGAKQGLEHYFGPIYPQVRNAEKIGTSSRQAAQLATVK